MTNNHSESFPEIGTNLLQCSIADSDSSIVSDSNTCCVLALESDQLIEGEHLLNVICTVLECNLSDIQSIRRIIIDSGASNHMTPSKCLLSNIGTTINGSVSLGDISKKLNIVSAGYTTIPILGLVYLVPQLSFGLISIPTLDKVGCSAMFNSGRVFIFNEKGHLLLTGTLKNKLYYLDEQFIDILYNNSQCNNFTSDEYVQLVNENIILCDEQECIACIVNSNDENNNIIENPCLAHSVDEAKLIQGSAPKRLLSTTVGLDPLELLHLRWGHLGEHNIKRALRLKMVTGAKYSYDDVKNSKLRICFGCMRGRMKAFVDSTGSVREYKPFEKIAIDYKGKFPTKSQHGNDGFYLISDASTDYLYPYPCKDKSTLTVLDVLNSFKTEIVDLNKYEIAKLQSDFDSVILSSEVRDWLLSNRIKLQVSAPYSHSQNGQIERDIQNVLDKARTLMAVYSVPRKYWDYAIDIACYLINRSPNAHSDKTPYELVFGEVPDISNLVPFYAPGVYHLTKDERHDSLSDKAVVCRMLGYDEKCKNTYIVLNINNGAIVSRKDCIFDESLGDIITMENIRENLDSNKILNDYVDADNEEVDDIDDNNSINSDIRDMNEGGIIDYKDENNLYWKESDSDSYNNTVLECYLSCVAHVVHKAIMLPPNPENVEAALKGPEAEHWYKAMKKELGNFDDRNTFSESPQEGRAMKTKWILKYAYNPDYTIKYKARLVACGYSQIYGVDYKDTYAPTTSTVLVNILFHLGAMYKLAFAVFDVTAAFLEGKNDFVQYARLPFDSNGDNAAKGQGMRVEVVETFYGEKQGPKIWNDQLDSILICIGFERSNVHNCLYKWISDIGFIMLTVHVDDGLMISSNDDMYTIFEIEFLKKV